MRNKSAHSIRAHLEAGYMRASLPLFPSNHFSLTPRGGFIHTPYFFKSGQVVDIARWLKHSRPTLWGYGASGDADKVGCTSLTGLGAASVSGRLLDRLPSDIRMSCLDDLRYLVATSGGPRRYAVTAVPVWFSGILGANGVEL